MNKPLTALAFILSSALTGPVIAANDHASHGGMAGMSGMSDSTQMAQMSGHDMSKMASPAPASNATKMSEAVVKKVDIASGKVTLQHGPLLNLDMPAMTMPFRMKDPSRINELKAGDKIKFVAENPGNVLTIGQFEKTM